MEKLPSDNQHYTPQLLLKGFTKPSKPRITIRYKKNDRTREKSIRRVASEDNFYRIIESNNSVDEANTQYENTELRFVISELRNAAPSQSVSVSNDKIEKAILHLWARSRNFRDALANPVDSFMEQCSDIFGSPEQLEKLFLTKSSPETDDRIYSELTKRIPHASNLSKPMVLRLIKEQFSNNKQIFDNIAMSAKQELDNAKKQIPSLAKSQHIEFMSENPELPSDRFKGYTWQLWDDEKQNIVFPDCVLLAYNKNSGFRPLIFSDFKSPLTVLPLSPSRLLVGSPGNSFEVFTEKHIKSIGRCAFDFFIHPEKRDDLEAEKEFIRNYYDEFSTTITQSALSEYKS